MYANALGNVLFEIQRTETILTLPVLYLYYSHMYILQ